VADHEHEVDERGIIERCIAGDTEAYEPLVNRYRQQILRLTNALLRDRAAAWDCAQEGFARAFHRLSKLPQDQAFYPWLLKITTDVAMERRPELLGPQDPDDKGEA
jgi:RNA polymerase sigma-70 factor (ECF subfamily)